MTARAGLRPIQRISRRGLISSGMFAGLLLASGLPVSAKGKGGTLRLAALGASAADSWDPRGHDGLFMQLAAQGAAFECLTEITPEGALSGELAESWDCDPSGRVWTFTLREGAMFHDGQPVLPEDVAASLLHHKDGSAAGYVAAQIEALRSPAPRQLEITLTGGNADFPFLLADPHLTIAPAGDFSRGIGSGMYRPVRFEPGAFIRLERLGQHWRDGSAGFFEAVEITARDLLSAPSLEAFDALGDLSAAETESLPNAQLLVTSGYRKAVAVLPQSWLGVRQELAAALPRAAFAGPSGQPSPDHPLSFSHRHARLDLPAETPDLLPDLIARGFDPAQLSWQRFEAGFTADAALSAALSPRGPLADMAQRTDIMDDLRAARASFDSRTRAALYGALQERIMREGPALWPATLPIVDARSARLAHGAQTSALLPLDGARIAKRWWFA